MGLFRRKRWAGRKPSVGKSWGASAETTGNESVSNAVEGEDIANGEAGAAAEPANLADSERVFHFFREISAIPHGSHHTDAISDYLVKFAEERGLACVRDEVNNVIISKNASAGAEEAAPIALQGHIDMVLASEPDKEIDLLTQPITIVEDGEWMRADGTTLGADNGIAVAMMLAVLDDDTLIHPYLECVFTSDEEVGLIGANAIDLSGLRSRRLLNLDSEEEGVFCAGCAGGAEVLCRMPLKRKKRQGPALRIKVTGLMGGHSGAEIHLGRANSNVLMIRALYDLYRQFPFRLISIEGGDADNAIAASTEAKIQFKVVHDPDSIAAALEEITGGMAEEYSATEPGMNWITEWEKDCTADVISANKTDHILAYLLSLPNGVTQMNPVLTNMPQSSLNLGILRVDDDLLVAEFMVRSGINAQTAYISEQLCCITKGFGGEPEVRSSYPAWEYRNDSPFRDLAVEVYKKVNGKEPGVEVIHAGLECGILSGKLEGLDCISTGPDLQNVHTVRERMSIPSVKRVWTFMLALLGEAAAV